MGAKGKLFKGKYDFQGGGVEKKKSSMGGVWIFLSLHIVSDPCLSRRSLITRSELPLILSHVCWLSLALCRG